jgi:hypothetical protein
MIRGEAGGDARFARRIALPPEHVMLRILSAFLISFAASFFAAPFARAHDGTSGPGEERTQPPSPTDRLAGSLATDLVKACQLADPDDLPAFELCRPQAQQEPEQLQKQPQPQLQQAQQEQDQQQAQLQQDRLLQVKREQDWQLPLEPWEHDQQQAQQQQNAADQETVGQSTEPKGE